MPDTNPAAAAPLPAGTPAPDFTLHSAPDQTVSLRDYRGQPVILAFYPADWSPVCGDQMALYNEVLSDFDGYGARLLGVSVDGAWCHRAFADQRKLRFPLLADFEPKGAVARRYGVYREGDGFSVRRRASRARPPDVRTSSTTEEQRCPGRPRRRCRACR